MRCALFVVLLSVSCTPTKRCQQPCGDDNSSEPVLGPIETLPADGAVEVGRLPRITLTFTTPMDADVSANAFSLATAEGAAIAGTTFFEANATRLVFIPSQKLAADAVHVMELAATARSQDGTGLLAPRTWSFRTSAATEVVAPVVTVEPVPIIISTPDLGAGGSFTLSGTAVDAESGVDWLGIQVLPLGQTAVSEWPAPAYEGGSWTHAWAPLLMEPLPEGSYTLQLRAVDKAGEQIVVTEPLAVDVRGPAVPTATIPATWKFRTLVFVAAAEPLSTLAVTLDGAPVADSPFTVGEDGSVPVTLDLVALETPVALVLQAFDAEANAGAPLEASVTRTGYLCLDDATFPASEDAVLELQDDEEGQVVVTYRLDPELVDDTVLGSTTPTTSSGIASWLGLGTDPDFRILLRLASGVLPGCATITSALLTVHGAPPCSQCTVPVSVRAFPLLRDWSERDATWNLARSDESWEQPGANGTVDHNADAVAAVLVGNDLQFDARTFGGSGVVIAADDAGSRTLYASEHSNPALRPTLRLELVEPSE